MKQSTSIWTRSLIKRKFEDYELLTSHFVLMSFDLEIYPNQRDLEPQYQFMYKSIKRFKVEKTYFYFSVFNRLLIILIDAESTEKRNFLNYFIEKTEKFAPEKTVPVALDLTSFFDPLNLICEDPRYVFDYHQFKIEFEEIKKQELEKQALEDM